MGLDASGFDMEFGNNRSDIKDCIRDKILLGVDRSLCGYGLAGSDRHKADLVERSIARHSLDFSWRRCLYRGPGVFRRASIAL